MNWYPGHMAKSINQIKKIIKNSHIILEILDIRCFKTSHNEELMSIVPDHKTIVKIFVRCDLVSGNDIKKVMKKYPNALFISNKDPNSKKIIIDHILKQEVYLKKLFINIFVIGIPNVGKSTLINNLINKRKIKVQNKPGQTRLITPHQLSEKIYLFDTPGILHKKIKDNDSGCILGLTNLINEKVLELDEVIDFGCRYLLKNYHEYFKKSFPLIYKWYCHDINTHKLKYLQEKNIILNDKNADYKKGLLFIFRKLQKTKTAIIWDY